jgi:Flp pilus assembly pilin Flp
MSLVRNLMKPRRGQAVTEYSLMAAFGAFLAVLASARGWVQGAVAGGIAAVEEALQPVIRLLGL